MTSSSLAAFFFFSSRRRHTRCGRDWSSDVCSSDLWKRSGHLDFYRENMFTPIRLEDAEYQLKPMNCPFHILIYKDTRRSYRELPMRLAEFGTVYRYERSGVMHGLLRVRVFTHDDSHIVSTAEGD